MKSLIDIYAEELKNAPQTAKIERLFDKGLITYSEAIQSIVESAEKNKVYYVIQYKAGNMRKYCDIDKTLLTYEEAKEELNRLKDAGRENGFSFRTRTELK